MDFFVIVYNTAHVFYNKFQKEVRKPILNLKELVKKFVKDYKSIVVLGTSTTINRGLYNFNGKNRLVVDKEDLSLIDEAVFKFNNGTDKELQKKIVFDIAKKYIKKGAEVVLVGCTELSLMLKDKPINKIDTMDILINGIIDKISK